MFIYIKLFYFIHQLSLCISKINFVTHIQQC